MTLPQKNAASGPLFILILSGLMAFASLSTDIYLPAMPVMAAELQGDAELTITGFLIGFAVAQLIWGPIGDRLGRRTPLFIGMVLFIIGSVGCALSVSIDQIIFWRVFQALGACTGPMLARAMVRDLFARTRAAQMLSTLTIVMAIAPIIGPLLGGQLISVTSWHAIFWLLAGIGLLMLLALRWLPETLPPERRQQGSPLKAFHHYGQLLRNRIFIRYTLSLTCYYVAAYAFITGSPDVYIRYFGVEPQHYGWLFAVNILGLMTMSLVNRRLVQRYALGDLLKVALVVASLAMVAMAFSVKLHHGGLVGIALCVFLFFSMNGVIAATSTAAALDEAGEFAGSASAFIGALQYGSGIVSSLLLAGLHDGTPWTMTWIMGAFTLVSLLLAWTPSAPRLDELNA
ncbi:multidrug effflux MFS transporter [Raoultella planticola]|jgi:DHA1 family bicyclomycin/chloramphenicol resistance-like MFS transporter|uniref:multidrug effflux MFS transporter n=2 Tax=Raoultella planticola TaxID=575 RepID=UPI00066BC1C2|nr:multidrug effflux MFS transporter [Raoultella planticola]AUV53436.1 MFS transporter [Raoultella planticola]EJR0223043.1 multidrug effflux MFS transporter [Raoultella planticola]EJR0355145.1 multidrug effflux MFS transporter [Raoultella planticola]ELU1430408.1 multidrug effflux MFS transporter [Raoultella planticola]MCQ6501254.1 multidrug effflux MFS transporter [Raoultella planticola]